MVGIYLDGVYIGKSIGSLFDVATLERVEVPVSYTHLTLPTIYSV